MLSGSYGDIDEAPVWVEGLPAVVYLDTNI